MITATLTSRFIMFFLMILRQVNPTHSRPVTLCLRNFGALNFPLLVMETEQFPGISYTIKKIKH